LSDPQLKNDARFEAVRERLQSMRVRIAQDRDRYNESLRNYNLFVGEFPNGMWAKVAGYKPDYQFFPNVGGAS
jgi:LemA protein